MTHRTYVESSYTSFYHQNTLFVYTYQTHLLKESHLLLFLPHLNPLLLQLMTVVFLSEVAKKTRFIHYWLLTRWLRRTFCIFSFEFHLIDSFRVAEWGLNMEMDSTGYEWGEKLFRRWMVRPLTPARVFDRPSFSQLIAVGRRLTRHRLFMTNKFVAYVFRHRYWVFIVHSDC